MFDYFKKFQDSMVDSMNKTIKQINKSMSSKYKKPSCEISQSKKELVIGIGLPGMEKKNISLHVTHDYLEVFAEQKIKKTYSKGEFLGYRRVIPLPPGLIVDNINAKFRGGRLNIKIPKIKIGKIKVK